MRNLTDLQKKLLAVFLTITALGIALLFYFFKVIIGGDYVVSPVNQGVISRIIEKPLEKYTIVNLGYRQNKASPITKIKQLTDDPDYTSELVTFTSGGKKVSGMLNTPKKQGLFPVILMIRGYVDPTIYRTGIGTERGAEVFAKNGFITFAPDYLGYADSDKEAINIFESRFETYTVTLDALASIPNIEKFNGKIGIWGHSNGGQIALTILEATQAEYPTVLWAPVTKPFPYSILYYTDEADDRGKFLRKELSQFELEYDVNFYSLADYIGRIKAPVQLHQGSVDEAVPQKWSDDFKKALDKAGNKATYYIYPGADHNLNPSWNTAITRGVEFYKAQFSQ